MKDIKSDIYFDIIDELEYKLKNQHLTEKDKEDILIRINSYILKRTILIDSKLTHNPIT